jgi:hypothetical protein
VTPLHHFGGWLRATFLQIDLSHVRVLFVGINVALLIWVLTLPRAATTPPDRPARMFEDLRIWAGLALLCQIGIYLAF